MKERTVSIPVEGHELVLMEDGTFCDRHIVDRDRPGGMDVFARHPLGRFDDIQAARRAWELRLSALGIGI
ncbi:MAG: hypothetical protein LKE37_05035 [Atopobiaceae bacterium]|jgi:hypothetical protein|nr:hypothetical protein [Atopobiaceae bacterium]